VVEKYPRYDLENVFDLDDLQFSFLVNGLGAIFALEAANAVPGMIDNDGMKALQSHAPPTRVGSDETLEWLQEQCEEKGLTPPKR